MASYQKSKALAVMFLLGAFLTGGAVGFAADRAVTERPYVRQYDRQAFLDEFAQQLDLSTEQRRVVDSIFDWRGERHREIRMRIKPSIDSLFDSARVLINQNLDSTQKVRFRALLDSNAVRDSVKRAQEAAK